MPKITLVLAYYSGSELPQYKGLVTVTSKQYTAANQAEFNQFTATCACGSQVTVCRSGNGHILLHNNKHHICTEKKFQNIVFFLNAVNKIIVPDCFGCDKVTPKKMPLVSMVWQSVPTLERIVVFRIHGLLEHHIRHNKIMIKPHLKWVQPITTFKLRYKGITKRKDGRFQCQISDPNHLCSRCKSTARDVSSLPQFVCAKCGDLYGHTKLTKTSDGFWRGKLQIWANIDAPLQTSCDCGRKRNCIPLSCSKATSATHCVLSPSFTQSEVQQICAYKTIQMIWCETKGQAPRFFEYASELSPPVHNFVPHFSNYELIWFDQSRVIGGCGQCSLLSSDAIRPWPCKLCIAEKSQYVKPTETDDFIDGYLDDTTCCFVCTNISSQEKECIRVPPLPRYPQCLWGTIQLACKECTQVCDKCGYIYCLHEHTSKCYACRQSQLNLV